MTPETGHRPPAFGEGDQALFREGRHRRLWEVLGSHPGERDGRVGTAFAVWAPSARRVSVVGDFCDWDGSRHPMRRLAGSGVHELFVPGVGPGDLYKYEIEGQDGVARMKADPLALRHEQWPGTASIVQARSSYRWHDGEWMAARQGYDATRRPVSIYEVHLSSWRRVPEEGNRPLTYREIAPLLARHCTELGFTHVELMPLMEHPFGGSWGYQVTGYFAPTSRLGTPDDFRFLVDTLHQAGLGVILDWVPSHFPGDEHGLARFDGSPLYEPADPRLGHHPDWNTFTFDYSRPEVRNLLLASALYWLSEYHADGLRVDAVSSMLYRDYSRAEGEWVPNCHGGRENLEAIAFLRELNATVAEELPGCMMIAEESTDWSGVTADSERGGLGFTFKWNMGWMHDSLAYFSHDPIHRRWHHDQITFAMLYEHTERFLNPLSHDEVVHGKGSLLARMPGDEWQRLANLRALLAYQFLRPGKKLLFMGTELAPETEWDHDASLPWHLADHPDRQGIARLLGTLCRLYRGWPCLWSRDPETGGFQWIDGSDRENSVLAWLRWGGGGDAADHLVTVLNLTPLPRQGYRIGVPRGGSYRPLLNTDDERFGGSDLPVGERIDVEPIAWHGLAQSVALTLPPLAALVLRPVG
jgi:1,4-alpha-glucan branching enzyme